MQQLKRNVPFGESAPFQNEKGDWRVTVTIDNSSSVERAATAEEIAAAQTPADNAPPAGKKAAGKKA